MEKGRLIGQRRTAEVLNGEMMKYINLKINGL